MCVGVGVGVDSRLAFFSICCLAAVAVAAAYPSAVAVALDATSSAATAVFTAVAV